LSSVFRRKSPLRDLHRVVEHPDRLSKRLLEKTESQEAVTFSICRRKEERQKSLRGLSVEELRRDNTVCVRRLCRSTAIRIL
jgi:hypothetical protein